MNNVIQNILRWSFILLCIILFCNLNGVIYLIFKIRAPFSPLILVLSLIIIYIGIFKQQISLRSHLLLIIISFYVLYIFIGICSYLLDYTYVHGSTSVPILLRSYVSSIVIIAAFYIGAKSFALRKEIPLLLQLLFGTTLISILFAAFSPLVGLTDVKVAAAVTQVNTERESGLFGNPNEAGAFGLYFMIICLVAYGYLKKGGILFISSFLLGLYVVFSSFSRTSLMLSLLVIFVYVIYNLKYFFRLRLSNSRKPFIMGSFLIIGAIVVSQQFFVYVQSLTHSQRGRLLQTFQLFSGEINERTTSERSALFVFAWEEIKRRPLIGYGLGSFHKMKHFPGPRKMGVHNTHLLIFGESGIIPIFLFCLFFLLLGISGWTHYHPSLGFLIIGVCLTFFLNVAGSGHNALDDRTSNALLGIAIVLSQIKKTT